MSENGTEIGKSKPTHIHEGKPSRNFLIACPCGKGSKEMSLPVEHYGLGSTVEKVRRNSCGEKRDHVVIREL
jgi:hypothetical protein